MTKQQQQQQKQKNAFTRSKRSHLVYFIQSQFQSQSERPTCTSRSLQSITRPFQKRFREVFGNARILIFYLSIKAWGEKSLPKSHLGWFFLVFGVGKATKQNISIFWFI